MTPTKAHEYHELELESSNRMILHDSRWVLGRYEEAALHLLHAGAARARMGQLCFDAEEYVDAVQDWLSAADCFLRATAPKEAADVLAMVHRIEADGKIPVERPELDAGLKAREQGLQSLNQKVQQFLRAFGLQGHHVDVADERTLRYLIEAVRELPGLPSLHYAIFRQAAQLGQQELAETHLAWATRFDPTDASLAALLGHRYLQNGDPDRAVALGNDFLAAYPSSAGPVRIMLANALASNMGSNRPQQERAIEVLRPLVDNAIAEVRERIAALALSASFEYELGHEQEFRRLLHELDRLEGVLEDPELRDTIADFRGMLPNPGANGAADATDGVHRSLRRADRLRLVEKSIQVSVRAMPVAA